MRYLSCFSGIGGLEASKPPILFCESDAGVASVLKSLHPEIDIWPDVQTLIPPVVDVVAGGWPCQDLSIAGQQVGLKGLRSNLLIDMLRVANKGNAHTVVAENVPNLLRMRNGQEFAASLEAFNDHGFRSISWRILNTRQFGLPQNRSRLLLIASKEVEISMTLFRDLPILSTNSMNLETPIEAAGFYWTAGTHSINYNRGYVPTIKIGSSLGIASPPAVHYGNVVRTLSPSEALALQGFDINEQLFPSVSSAYKAAGNAVARPIGRWVMDGLTQAGTMNSPNWLPAQDGLFPIEFGTSDYPRAGITIDGNVTPIKVSQTAGATNLIEFLDTTAQERLSARASKGLLERLKRSGQPCPSDLGELLEELAA